MNNNYLQNYNPDVLSCIANLSNDEVFTPPELANSVLDMLPQELWSDPNAKFLDPFSKSGVFLREIAKRLLVGLEKTIPDLQTRIDHIFQKQIYGIAITELTSLLTRRSLYCSKYPNCKYSISEFETIEGNVRYKRVEHTFKDGKCIYCSGSFNIYNKTSTEENYAYEFIHTTKPEEIFNMKFDVIVGNPPYQLSTNDGKSAQAVPLYHKFVEQAKKLNPRYLSMIIPSRWFTSGMGLNTFRKNMINDRRIKEIHDFTNAKECFPGVEIKGGVCYFLWERNYNDKCLFIEHKDGQIISKDYRYLKYKNLDMVIRFNKSIKIIEKIQSLFDFKTFKTIISPISPFGLESNYSKLNESSTNLSYKVYANNREGYLDNLNNIKKNIELVSQWKVFVAEAIGTGDSNTDWIKPFIGEPKTLSTATYLAIGPLKNKDECLNIISYIDTKFFHFLLTQLKNTHHTPARVYELIPMQDFSKSWTDKELYEKYNLTQDEINFIESMVRPEIGTKGE